jgi:uncharacterized protein (DUF58 family)
MNPLSRRWQHWWLQRHPRTDTLTLNQGNIYIVPTKAGLAFAATLIVMLLASINYQLSLGYVLTFLLAGSGLTSMHLTHGTLRGLSLHLRPPAPVFAGEPATLEVVINSSGRISHGVGLRVDPGPEAPARFGRPVWVDVPAQGQAMAHLSFEPAQRGWHAVPVLRAETRYPFGLFRAWTVWRPAARVLAYPAPEQPPAPLPPATPLGADSQVTRSGAGSDFEGVRSYQRGDAMKQIVWKKVARTGEIVSRDSRAPTQQQLWLDWQATALAEPEQRLSRLAAWVLAAEQAGLVHGLRLPGVELAPASGEAHRRQALEALALWA